MLSEKLRVLFNDIVEEVEEQEMILTKKDKDIQNIVAKCEAALTMHPSDVRKFLKAIIEDYKEAI